MFLSQCEVDIVHLTNILHFVFDEPCSNGYCWNSLGALERSHSFSFNAKVCGSSKQPHSDASPFLPPSLPPCITLSQGFGAVKKVVRATCNLQNLGQFKLASFSSKASCFIFTWLKNCVLRKEAYYFFWLTSSTMIGKKKWFDTSSVGYVVKVILEFWLIYCVRQIAAGIFFSSCKEIIQYWQWACLFIASGMDRWRICIKFQS